MNLSAKTYLVLIEMQRFFRKRSFRLLLSGYRMPIVILQRGVSVMQWLRVGRLTLFLLILFAYELQKGVVVVHNFALLGY